MLTYLIYKEFYDDGDMPTFVFLLMIPICILLDIIFIPFQYLFYRIYLKREKDGDNNA